MQISSSTQTFVLAMIAFVGFFAYVIVVTLVGKTVDPTIFPAILGLATLAGSFFFSGHIANGAAGKALDALVQTGKDRETAIDAASALTNGTAKPGA